MNAKSSQSRLVGYACFCANSQSLQLRLDVLKKFGVARTDGSKAGRRLDPLGRSVRHPIDVVEELRQHAVKFQLLCENAIDTTSASREFVFHIFNALAELKRYLMSAHADGSEVGHRCRWTAPGFRPQKDCTPIRAWPSRTSAERSKSAGQRFTDGLR